MKIRIIILIVLIQTSLPFSKIKADSKLGVGLNLAGLAIGNVNLEGAIPLSRHLSLHLPLSWNPIRISDKVSFRHFAFPSFWAFPMPSTARTLAGSFSIISVIPSGYLPSPAETDIGRIFCVFTITITI